MKEHPVFRGVCWPKPQDGLYRYAIMGIVVSQTPLEELEKGNEFVLEGDGQLIVQALEVIPKREPNLRCGDANFVMTNLNIL